MTVQMTQEQRQIERTIKERSLNNEMIALTRWRDGDQCRKCGNLVDFSDRRSQRGGSYMPASGVLYVVCRACSWANRPTRWREVEHSAPGLLPVPARPVYRPATVRMLKKAGLHNRRPMGSVQIKRADQALSIFHPDFVAGSNGLKERLRFGFGVDVPRFRRRDFPMGVLGDVKALGFAILPVHQRDALKVLLVKATKGRAFHQASDEDAGHADDRAGVRQKDLGAHKNSSSVGNADAPTSAGGHNAGVRGATHNPTEEGLAQDPARGA